MRRHISDRGFTLIELLVVVAIIALLISILLPSLQGARDQGKRAKCLANMKSIATGSIAYATEDRRELVTPIQQMAVSTLHTQGFAGAFVRNNGGTYPAGELAIRLAIPTAFGGRTPQIPIAAESGAGCPIMMDPLDNPGGSDRWLAKTRPLNKYVMGSNEDSDSKNLAMYQCPADTGYPENAFIQDAPRSVINVPTYDFLGNSYRINVAGYFWTGSGGGAAGQFSVGVWGKAYSKLVQTGKVAMYCEPIFYNASRVLGEIENAPDLVGWHKARLKDNVAYADGSARSTLAVQMIDWPTQLLAEMNVATDNPWYFYLRRGDQWRTDTYPTPGSRIVMRTPAGQSVTPMTPAGMATRWPYAGHNTID
jgi:prepilin-type N-terminal cleavage/methylation domain-containing protein